jgi:hypothetical protein
LGLEVRLAAMSGEQPALITSRIELGDRRGYSVTMHFGRIYGALLWAVDDILCRRLFPVWERMGFHVTLNHFYQPIPDTGRLRDELWSRESGLAGVDINEQRQIELIDQFLRFKSEYDTFPRDRPAEPWRYYQGNPHFGPVDAEVLYRMIRHFRPGKIVEIGSGYSTYVSAQAVLRNEEENGHRAELIAVEPRPNRVLRSGFPGLSRLIPERAEQVAPTVYESLRENDILFIDSSHVLRIGGDVHHEYLEILPRLSKGVLVHIHDVFFPFDYPRKWVLEMHRFWNEQYLAQAFLAFNTAFEILWCGSYMHARHPDKLEEAFASYDRATVWSTRRLGATSLWLRRVA